MQFKAFKKQREMLDAHKKRYGKYLQDTVVWRDRVKMTSAVVLESKRLGVLTKRDLKAQLDSENINKMIREMNDDIC